MSYEKKLDLRNCNCKVLRVDFTSAEYVRVTQTFSER